MSRRSPRWLARNFPGATTPPPATAAENHLRQMAALYNSLVPPCATRIDVSQLGHLRYLHPTKGWREVSRQRFRARGAEALLPA